MPISCWSRLRDPLRFLKSLWIPGGAARKTAVLVMQTEENYLHFRIKPRWWRIGGKSLNSELPPGMKKAPSYIPMANEITKRLARRMNGDPMSMWSEVLLDAPTTAHILGGCAMAESPDNGVVGFSGEVFGHPSLYVADGSVVPLNLGVNPSLTIATLAEYIMSRVPPK
jgi:cholesterol oxidase